jgi:hypothetical protein
MESYQLLMDQWTHPNGSAHLRAASITQTLKQWL